MGDGAVLLPTPAATRLRHLQKLRGSLSSCLYGRKRRSDAWKGCDLRAQGRRWWCRRQEEVSTVKGHFHVCMAHDDACGERIRWRVQKRPKCNKACSFLHVTS